MDIVRGSQSESSTQLIYRRLADFFSNKGDAPLTSAEVTVCLEWLREVTQQMAIPVVPAVPVIPVFATPLHRQRTAPVLATPRHKPTEMTPVKQQILELLSAREELPEKKDTIMTSATTEAPAASSTVTITRTAKTILDILDKPIPEAFTERRPILLAPAGMASSQSPQTSVETMVTLDSTINLPLFDFEWDESMQPEHKGMFILPDPELPKFSFDE